MKKYTSFWSFLRDTPKNTWSIILIWGMAIAGMIVSTQDKSDFDKGVYEGVLIFLSLIMFLGWFRVWMIYQKNKETSHYGSIASNVESEEENSSGKNYSK